MRTQEPSPKVETDSTCLEVDVKPCVPCTPEPEIVVGVAVRALSPVIQHQEPAQLDPVVQFRQLEYRAGMKGSFPDIPSWPMYLAPEEVVAEIPLYEFDPVGRKCYTPIRSQCCTGAGHQLYRHRRCDCHSR